MIVGARVTGDAIVIDANGPLNATAESDRPRSFAAPKPVAIRSTGQKGEFLFTLATPADAPLTLHYHVAGNALPGIDYKRVGGKVTMPAGASTARVNVKQLVKGTDENSKPTKVELTLEPGLNYTVGTPATAVVKIREHQ